MTVTFFDEIADTLSRAEAAAYARGKEAGRKEILDELIASAQAKQQAPRSGAIEADSARPSSDRTRAPKGTVRRLINRVLSSRPGLRPIEILAHAETDYEKMVQAPSLRNQLRRGLGQGQYRRTHGHWYLADPGENEAEGLSSEGAPSASNTSQGGPYETALDENDMDAKDDGSPDTTTSPTLSAKEKIANTFGQGEDGAGA